MEDQGYGWGGTPFFATEFRRVARRALHRAQKWTDHVGLAQHTEKFDGGAHRIVEQHE